MKANIQTAPYPDELADLVGRLRYRPGWRFVLATVDRDKDREGQVVGSGLTLDIITRGFDSYHPERGENYSVHHYRIVPPATYNRQSWRRWLLDQCLAVEGHEACEFFVIEEDDGTLIHPFAPNHGPGADPYRVVEYESEEARRTSFRGTLNPA